MNGSDAPPCQYCAQNKVALLGARLFFSSYQQGGPLTRSCYLLVQNLRDRSVANQVSDLIDSGAFRFRCNLILIRSFGQISKNQNPATSNLMFLLPPKKHTKTRSTLLYTESNLKSQRQFNQELKAPHLNLKALDCTHLCSLQSHRHVSNREGTRYFYRTFSSDSI